MEEKPLPPANGSLDETSGPTSTISAEHDEEKIGTLGAVSHSLPDVYDEKAESKVAAVPEEPAKPKGRTALIMVAICVRKVYNVSYILRNQL